VIHVGSCTLPVSVGETFRIHLAATKNAFLHFNHVENIREYKRELKALFVVAMCAQIAFQWTRSSSALLRRRSPPAPKSWPASFPGFPGCAMCKLHGCCCCDDVAAAILLLYCNALLVARVGSCAFCFRTNKIIYKTSENISKQQANRLVLK